MVNEERWLCNYNFAKKYYEKYGNLLIPKSYVVFDEDDNLVKLGNWICTQRYAYKGNSSSKLNEKQIKLLEEIEMVWEVRNNEEIIPPKWMKNYNLAKKYYEEHGNLLMPNSYVIFDKNSNLVKLGNWIYTQRRVYNGDKEGLLMQKQIKLLEEIEMVWNAKKYQSIISKIERNFLYYQLGMLDQRNVEALLENKMLVYSDDKKIEKGNAIILARKKVS